MRKLKTPISYYGGKQRMAKHILSLIPKHIQYVEPFMGGGAIFWAKPKSQHEVINDFDNRVMNFWTVLRDDFEALQYKIQSTLHSEYYYKQAKEILKCGLDKTDPLLFAGAFWVQTNMSFSMKVFGGFAFGDKGNGKSQASATDSKRYQIIESLYQRLKHVEIFNRDAIDIIKLKDGAKTFFMLDPPYPESNCGHYDKGKDVFYRLLELLPQLKAKWLLCSYPSRELDELRLTNGYNKQDTIQPLSVSGKHNAGKNKIECLTYNYMPEGKSLSLF